MGMIDLNEFSNWLVTLNKAQWYVIITTILALDPAFKFILYVTRKFTYLFSKRKYLDCLRMVDKENLGEIRWIYLKCVSLLLSNFWTSWQFVFMPKKYFEKFVTGFISRTSNNYCGLREYVFMNVLIGRGYEFSSKYRLALEYYERAVYLYDEIRDTKNYYSALLLRDRMLSILGKNDFDDNYILNILNHIHANVQNMDALYIQACLMWGEALINKGTTDAYAESSKHIAKALENRSLLKRRDKSRAAIIRIGNTFKLKKYDEVLSLCSIAMGNEKRCLPFLNNNIHLSNILNHQAIAYSEKEDYEEAERSMKCAVKYAEKHKDFFLKAKIIGNYAVILEKEKKYEEALELHKRVLALFEFLFGNSHFHIAKTKGNMGMTYAYLKDFVNADKYILQSIQMYIDEYGNCPHVDLANSYRGFAKRYLIEGDLKNAENYYSKSIEMYYEVLSSSSKTLKIAINNLLESCDDASLRKKLDEYIAIMNSR
jgi:tetratricopeptide (TPR) repeat protein